MVGCGKTAAFRLCLPSLDKPVAVIAGLFSALPSLLPYRVPRVAHYNSTYLQEDTTSFQYSILLVLLAVDFLPSVRAY